MAKEVLDNEGWLAKGSNYHQKNELLKAIECYDSAIRLKPDNALSHYNKGVALRGLGRNLESIECYDAAIRLKPDYASAYLNKGVALKGLERKQEATECYEAAIRLKPDYAKAYFNKGNSFTESGKKLEAIELYNEAIKLKPDYIEAYYNKGNSLSDLGRKLEAIECYDTAIRLKPDDAASYNNRGVNFSELGRKQEAIECYDAAIRLRPNELLYYFNRTIVLNSLGRDKEALNDFNRARALMQEEQNGSSNLSKGSINDINEALKKDSLQLLDKLTKLYEFKEELQQLKIAVGDNAKLQKQIDDENARIRAQNIQIIENVVDLIRLKQQDEKSHQKILSANKEIVEFEKRLLEEISQLRMQGQKFGEKKASGVDLRMINPVIESNSKLKNYIAALSNRLYSALSEAENICDGRDITIDNSSIMVNAFFVAIELIPFVGSLLSNPVSGVPEIMKKKDIRARAIKFQSTIGSNPNERQLVIKNASEAIALNSKNKMDCIETNIEVRYWIKKRLIASCKDFMTIDADSMLDKSKPQILGCIDALKIIYAIENDQVNQNSNSDLKVRQIAEVLSSYNFNKGKKIMENQDRSASTCCKIFYANEIRYANPLLSKLSLLNELSSITGYPLFRVIDCSNILIELGYDVEGLELEILGSLIISLNL
ncbi:unnamed protein product [Blepharisma stoltei]|uniref:Tetratricopeptide repeat protein n=1 Tax=Blepharisma stoltei TaxID=1481888 RepID=A0AAU9IYK9_9CILI|nr:unnamed protein product [Blepharisma stoltei]